MMLEVVEEVEPRDFLLDLVPLLLVFLFFFPPFDEDV
jgi:hypothetical protein